MKQILRIDASARHKNSYSRALTDRLMNRLIDYYPDAKITNRDIYTDSHFLSEAMAEGMTSAMSDSMIEELLSTDILVLAVPMYNFSIPAALKAYIDLVVRAGRTFRYTANGPEGLVKGNKVYIVVTSNGTPFRGSGDFVSTWLEYILRFIGVNEIQFVDATEILLKGAYNVIQKAENVIDQLPLTQTVAFS